MAASIVTVQSIFLQFANISPDAFPLHIASLSGSWSVSTASHEIEPTKRIIPVENSSKLASLSQLTSRHLVRRFGWISGEFLGGLTGEYPAPSSN